VLDGAEELEGGSARLPGRFALLQRSCGLLSFRSASASFIMSADAFAEQLLAAAQAQIDD
jgi:hypothetical protein